MTVLYLVLVDTSGIQSYVFGSNRLRENVGASHLVYLATQGWILEEPDTFLPTPHNVRDGSIAPSVTIERTLPEGEVAAEVMHAGGGNLSVIFRTESAARAFSRALSTRLLTTAPGLDAVLVIEPFSWGDSLAAAMERAHRQLATKKASREWSQPVLGLGVTASCRSTGLVANYLEAEPGVDGLPDIPISVETKAKWEQNAAAKRRLERSLDVLSGSGLEIPDQFEHLGRSLGEFSYIGVVHADGNGVGKAVRALTRRYRNHFGNDNRLYIQALRDFSQRIDRAGLIALNECVSAVVRWRYSGQYISIRPIVFGGDDVTFVCDGRVALQAAQVYLNAFHRQMIPDADGNLTSGVAAAGIAIVKSNYPFARAYALSERLCKNAKQAVQRRTPALDWHMAQGGLLGSLSEIRRQEYDEERNDAGEVTRSLLMRPVTVGENPVLGWRTWENFVTLHRTFHQQWPKNKLMALRETLREGINATQIFTHNFGPLPTLANFDGEQYSKTGWHENRCVYFDAIDMIEQEIEA